jgi:cyclic pyranopterin phosphate synthase
MYNPSSLPLSNPLPPADAVLIDRFGRRVDYLRLSITDRCDFRCVYCMSEEMVFVPRKDILTLEEITRLCRAFVGLGVAKIRITGGEPLIRKGVLELLGELGKISGLEQLVLTTNGSRLRPMAEALKAAGIKRINVSLDTLNPEKFRKMTRTGELNAVLDGIEAALEAGFERVKINAVILKHRNHDEVNRLVDYAIARCMDLSFIEEMPLGQVEEHDRLETYYSSDEILRDLQKNHTLLATPETTGGPSRYWQVEGTSTRVGFISPHSHNFCAGCNRVRVTAEGRLLLCLGNEHSVDLKSILRANPDDDVVLRNALLAAMAIKPERHHFDLTEAPVIFRHMSVTGG